VNIEQQSQPLAAIRFLNGPLTDITCHIASQLRQLDATTVTILPTSIRKFPAFMLVSYFRRSLTGSASFHCARRGLRSDLSVFDDLLC